MNDDPNPETRLQATVYGRVQGVNFRYFTASAARQLGLNGWVANRWDGTVEVMAEGKRGALEELLTLLHRGSPYSRVSRIAATWQTSSGEYDGFTVRNVG